MLLNAFQKVIFIVCVLLSTNGIWAVARADNNWSHRRPNNTVAQNHRGQAAYRPAVNGYQQPFAHNQTQWQHNQPQYPQQHWKQPINNRTQFNQPAFIPAIAPQPQQPAYGQRAFNQTRPIWNHPSKPQTLPYPYGQGSLNQSRPVWNPPASHSAQPNAYGQGLSNQTRPVWNPAISQQVPSHPQPNTYGQGSVNNTLPAWSQPSAPNLYPVLPNTNSWSPPTANQTHFNPAIPQPPTSGVNGIGLPPLQPPQNPQGPHNWHSGGQAVLSYVPGQYPSAAADANKNSSARQGSSNPYASMFN